MAEPFDRLIKEINGLMTTLKNDSTKLLNLLQSANLIEIKNNNKPTPNSSKELKDILVAFVSQDTYTAGTLMILAVPIAPKATIEDLKTTTNLVQIYFQVTQPLEKILSSLLDNLPSPLPANFPLTEIQTSIQIINTDRINLLEAQNKALQEFGSILDELDLKKLVQIGSSILNDLKKSADLSTLSDAIDRLISHLTSAQEFFQTFGENDGNITGNEPNEIQQLIKNWGESVAQVETIEKTNPTIQKALGIPSNSRLAIAQSIKIHDLLETNYDYLTALVRSIDLVSAGSL